MVEGVLVVDNHELASAGVQKEREPRSDARTHEGSLQVGTTEPERRRPKYKTRAQDASQLVSGDVGQDGMWRKGRTTVIAAALYMW